MPEPSSIQRLLRERALNRYIAALEKGDLDTLADVMRRAEKDALLEAMIFELHETYQTEEEFLAMVQEENAMEIEGGIHKSRPARRAPETDLPPEPEDTPDSEPRFPPWLRVLAAVLLVCVIVGSFLVVRNLRVSQVTTSSRPQNWCVRSGAAVDSSKGEPMFDDIAALSASNVWVIGQQQPYQNSALTSPLIEHWDGARWSVVPTPDPRSVLNPSLNNQKFDAISAVSANDIWVVGGAYHFDIDTLGLQVFFPLIERWDGSSWKIIRLPASFPRIFLNSVVALSASDVWVAGENRNESLVEHWDGSQWSQISLPAAFNSSVLDTLAAIAPDDIWAAGSVLNTQGIATSPFFAHWDGQQWKRVPAASVGDGAFSRLVARGPNDIWAVGAIYTGLTPTSTTRAVIEHWDGTRWSVVGGLQSDDSRLMGALEISPQDIWAVGSTGTGDYQQVLIEHWDGHSWKIVSQPHTIYGYLRNVAQVGGSIWAVGSIINFVQLNVTGTLLESC